MANITQNAYIPGWMHTISKNAKTNTISSGDMFSDTYIVSSLSQYNLPTKNARHINYLFEYLSLWEHEMSNSSWLDIALILIGQNGILSDLDRKFGKLHKGICKGKFLTYPEARRAMDMTSSFSGYGHVNIKNTGWFSHNDILDFNTKDYYFPFTSTFFDTNLVRSHVRWNGSNVGKGKEDTDWYYYLKLKTTEEEIVYAAGGRNNPVNVDKLGAIAFSCTPVYITNKINVFNTKSIFCFAVCVIAYETYKANPFVTSIGTGDITLNVANLRSYMNNFTNSLSSYISKYNAYIKSHGVKNISGKNGETKPVKTSILVIYQVKSEEAPQQHCSLNKDGTTSCTYQFKPTTKYDHTTGKVYGTNSGGNFIITKSSNSNIVNQQDRLFTNDKTSILAPSSILGSGNTMNFKTYKLNFPTDGKGNQIGPKYDNNLGPGATVAPDSDKNESGAGGSTEGDQPKEIVPDQGVMDILNNGIDKEDPNNVSSGKPTGTKNWFLGKEDIYAYMHNDNTVFDGASFNDKNGKANTDRSKFVDIIQSLQPLSLWGVGGMPATFLATTDPPAWWLSDKQTGGERYGLGNIYLNHYIKYGSYVTFRPCLPRFDSAILSLGSEILSSPIDAVKNVIQKIITGNAMELEGQAYRYWGQVSRMCRVAIYLMGIQHETIRFVTGKALIGDIIKQASNRAGVHFDPYGEEFQFGAMRADAWSTIGMEFNSIISNTPRVSPNSQSKDGGKDSKSSDDTYGHYSKSRDYDKLHVSKYHGGSERWKKETVEQGAIIKNKAEKLGSVSSSGEITPGGDEGKAGDPIKLEGDLDYGTVSFMLDGPLEISESMQNTSGESAIATALASVSGDSSDGMKEVLQGMFGARANEGLIGLFTGNYMIPKVYSSSSASRNYSMSMVFSSFSGDPVAIFLNCIYPLIKLQALTFPEATGGLLYSPWIVNMYSSQGVNIEWGLITDLSVKKDPATYNDAGMPTTLNVTVGVEDLRPFAFMEKPTFWSYASKFSGSATMMLASLVGRNFTTISYEQKQAFRDVMARLNYAEEVGRLGTEWRISVSRWGARLGSWFHNVYDRANDKYNSFDSWLTDLSGQDAYSKALSKVDHIISTTNAIANK